MGIKGLWKKVSADYESRRWNFDEPLHANSVLLVDATGFIFHLLDEQVKTLYANVPLKREFGGSYALIEDLMVKEIQRLTKKLGFELTFYFDGSESYYKGNTTAKRRQQLVEQWNNMYYAGLGDGTPQQKDLPLPPLCSQMLMHVLDRFQIRWVRTDNEADQKMALDCFNMSDSEGEERFYCYTGDSDFLLMKHCRTIRFGELDSASKKVGKGLTARVWKREALATAYGFESELHMVYWAILVGNDFTDHFPRQRLGYVGSQDIDELQRALASEEIVWRPEGIDDVDARQAVLFSVAFYELEDLQPFLLEQYKTVNQLEDAPDVDEGIRLSKALKDAVRAWYTTVHAKATPKKQQATGTELARVAINFLEYLRQDEAAPMTIEILKAEHLDACQRMVTSLAEKKPSSATAEAEVYRGKNVVYNDQKVANLFQLLIREIFHLVKAAQPSKNKQQQGAKPFKPTECYDGVLFHNLMHDNAVNGVPESELASKLRQLMLAAPSSGPTPSTAPVDVPPPPPPKPSTALPTDAYREEILQQIERDRVTIIHGETGCGKSSRVPLFILEEFEKKKKYCKIMITQPRRIAVINLKRRLQEQLGDQIGMRMGHGVREESDATKIFFVTTGYLVKLIAHHPAALASITHIIIDEVHERSLDSDLLCWLARQHLASCPDTRLVLMSATLHTTLYAKYFTDKTIMKRPPTSLSVGLRRFPVDIHYVESLIDAPDLPPKMSSLCRAIADLCVPPRKAGDVVVPVRLAKLQYDAAVALVRAKGRAGAGVLVFVSGIADIVELQSRFEGLDRYELVAIHSEIPFEEQELALTPPAPDKIKVILATNAAESSVTLPNVDVVICLGTHKAVNYKAGDVMRSMLENIWISKSSAIQRAGRTGRIRPGTVYRLYTQTLYETFIDFEEAEIHRKPLHEIILSLKATFQDAPDHAGVVPILAAMLEAPDLTTVDECFRYLYEGKMITAPTDAARLTSRGLFAGHMPIDVALSNVIMYGISLGVGPEAIVAAAALAQPKSPFRVAHPIVHTDPLEFNAIVRQTFLGAVHFDDGLYSDPLMMVRLFAEWQALPLLQQFTFCLRHGLVLARMKHFVSFAQVLQRHAQQLTAEMHTTTTRGNGNGHGGSGGRRGGLAQFFDADDDDDADDAPAAIAPLSLLRAGRDLTEAKVNRLRLALLWALDYNLIRSQGRKEPAFDYEDPQQLNELHIAPSMTLTHRLLDELFPPTVVPQRREVRAKRVYTLPMPFTTKDGVGEGLRVLLKLLFAHENVYFVTSSFTRATGTQTVSVSGKGGGSKKKNQKAATVTRTTMATTVLFAVRDPEAQFIALLKKQLPNGAMNGLQCIGRMDRAVVQEEIPAVVLFSLDGLDEDGYRRFRSVLAHARGVSLSVYAEGHAALATYDVDVDVAWIRALYAPATLSSSRVGAELDTALTKPKEHDVYECVTFVSPAASASVSEAAEAAPSLRRRSLFDDLALGMRLFNAYCVGQRERKMRYRALPPSDDDNGHGHGHGHGHGATAATGTGGEFVHPPRVVPGSAAWLQQKKAAAKAAELAAASGGVAGGGGGGAFGAAASFDVETFPQKSVLSPWLIVAGQWSATSAADQSGNGSGNGEEEDEDALLERVYDAPAKWDKVMLSSRSLIAASCHGPFPRQRPSPCPALYGVAYSAMTLVANNGNGNGGGGGGGGNNQVMVEGVTLFPAGADWVRRALYCVGKRLDGHQTEPLLTDRLTTSGGNGGGEKEITHAIMSCFVRSLVIAGQRRAIDVDETLIAAIDLLFADFLVATDDGSGGWTAAQQLDVRRRFGDLARRYYAQQQQQLQQPTTTVRLSAPSTSRASSKRPVAAAQTKKEAAAARRGGGKAAAPATTAVAAAPAASKNGGAKGGDAKKDAKGGDAKKDVSKDASKDASKEAAAGGAKGKKAAAAAAAPAPAAPAASAKAATKAKATAAAPAAPPAPPAAESKKAKKAAAKAAAPQPQPTKGDQPAAKKKK